MEHSNRRIGMYHSQYEHDGCGVGFVAHIKGEASNRILRNAQTMLERMSHRAALSADNASGDGSGVLTAIPHALFKEIFKRECGVVLPNPKEYAVANLFLPHDHDVAARCCDLIAQEVNEHKLSLTAFREMECDQDFVGPIARKSAPHIKQIAIINRNYEAEDFARILFVLRKRISALVVQKQIADQGECYFCSLSPHLIVYKGMLTPHQLFRYYPDLHSEQFETHFAMIHSRFSTNTFPSWSRAQPMRHISHNGEINTLRGNINKMTAREGALKDEESELLDQVGLKMIDMVPIINSSTSDSGAFDNVFEFLLHSGYSLPEVLMMMVPQAWEKNTDLPQDIRAAYQYFSNKMEPWDGPATISFCDGHYIGALLDRNGLRPSRYYVTDDDVVVMASEVGVLDIPPEHVVQKGRLQPGRMFLIDFHHGKIINDMDIKHAVAKRYPYQQWIATQRISLGVDPTAATIEHAPSQRTLRQFGYTTEHIDLIIKPMVKNAKEPLGSMGNDTPLAILSERPRLIYDYLHQLFAQVTNPPIDSIREKLIMSMHSTIGPEKSIDTRAQSDCRRIHLESPILFPAEYERLQTLGAEQLQFSTLSLTYPYYDRRGQRTQDNRGHDRRRGNALQDFLSQLCQNAERAIDNGDFFIVFSDRGAARNHIAVSPLLAVGAVHQHLVRAAKRTQVALIIDSAEPRQVHHFCTLLSYGADAIHPYLVYQIIRGIHESEDKEFAHPIKDMLINYREALHYGMRKVFGKMGISTLESYKGAQIFEIVGLDEEVTDLCFRGSASRIGGAAFNLLEEEMRLRHRATYPLKATFYDDQLENPGDYQWRKNGEYHQWHPEAIAHLQRAVRQNDPNSYRLFAKSQTDGVTRMISLRGLCSFTQQNEGERAIPIDEVEPAEDIMRRFSTGAMSFGSISKEAHETLALAMNRIGAKSNTGEGGEDPKRFIPLPDGSSLRSAIKQIASGRFGVGIEYLTNADEIQIKMAQGAKPGEGGELPGHKVLEVIARTRNSTPGVGLISPPPHHDIYSIEDLSQLIFDLKNANPTARISVKLVSAIGVGTIAAGVAKAGADHILISGNDGGTGASPLTGIKHAGLPWELGISETHQTLMLNELRSRVVLQTDGQLKTGFDVAIAAMLGAEEYGFSTAPLIALGCIMMRVCHLNTCPVGIATQDEYLRTKFRGRAKHVIRYFNFIAEEVRGILASLGIPSLDKLIGRSDLLHIDHTSTHWKSQAINLDAILYPGYSLAYHKPRTHLRKYRRIALEQSLDARLIADLTPTLQANEQVTRSYEIRNTDRAACTMLSNHIIKHYGAGRLNEDNITLNFHGSAGQSFCAWLTAGVTVKLVGDANDYVGKGLSGGKIIITPPPESPFKPEEHILIGNVALYGALQGQCFFRGIAAERFCVRNSGANVVIEGVGDHGCEYMTGGHVVIIGNIGRNFAAGMSGGIAYIWDPTPDKHARKQINTEIVDIESLQDDDERIIHELLRDHYRYTLSTRAEYILDNYEQCVEQFFRVISPSYRQILHLQHQQKREVSLE